MSEGHLVDDAVYWMEQAKRQRAKGNAQRRGEATARFWEWVNGSPVKLSLRPGKTVSWRQWRETDEGWRSDARTWVYDGELVYCEITVDGRDCDGRLTTYTDVSCAVDRLDRCEANMSPPLPDWQKRHSSQYDEFAARMGY